METKVEEPKSYNLTYAAAHLFSASELKGYSSEHKEILKEVAEWLLHRFAKKEGW